MTQVIDTVKTILTMADGTEKDVTSRFPHISDALFDKIVAATKAAGRTLPVSHRKVVTYRDATIDEQAEINYCDECDRIDKAMGY